MRKKILGVYQVLIFVGVLLIMLSFVFAKNQVMERMPENPKELLEPITVRQVDPDTREYIYRIDGEDDMSLCAAFFSSHQQVRVYEGGECVYELKNEGSIFGHTTGGKWNFVEISPGTEKLTVQLEAAYPEVRDYPMNMYLGNGIRMYTQMLEDSVMEVIVSILNMVVGIIFLGYYLIVRWKVGMNRGMLSFGLFALLLGTWSLNETQMMKLLLVNRTAASFMGYMLLMLLIIPFIFFVHSFLEMEDTRGMAVVCTLSIANLVICTFLHMTGIREFKQTVIGIQLMLLLCLCYLVYALLWRYRKFGFDPQVKANLVGLVFLSGAYLADIIAYNIGATKTDVFARFGFLLYIIVFGRQVALDTAVKLNEGKKAEIYRELAVRDMLTKLYNRNAYDSWVKETTNFTGITIVTFDLNDLKKCNDTLGHAAGDEYIQSAAGLIFKAFAPAGTCYRIGGDEFCVTVENVKTSWIENCLAELRRLQAEYNSTSELVKMHIACGYETFDRALDQDIEATRERADAKMYENKKQIKSNPR